MALQLTLVLLLTVITAHAATPATRPIDKYTLDFTTPTDPKLQSQLEKIDADLRAKLGMKTEQAAAGILDLRKLRLAMIQPDRIEYAASVPKIGILLAYFHDNPDVSKLDSKTRHELGLMTKASNNEMAAKFSQQLGLQHIQDVLDQYKLYDAFNGGGIWVGKHYGKSKERRTDPVGDHSHAATVRQLLRFYLLLEQGKLVSPEVCKTMKEIFGSPDIPHDKNKFVKALQDREGVQILRKWGTWENWHHDTAIITGPNRHYVLIGLTNHPKGDDYLESLATRVDDLLMK